MRFLLLLLFISQSSCGPKPSKSIPPVILVPGDGGSQLEAKLDKPSVVHYLCSKKTSYWFDLWLNMESLMPCIIDCWIDNMRLVYDNMTRSTSNAPGVLIRVPGFGSTSTVEWLDPSHRYPTSYFYNLVEAMVNSNLSYVRDDTVRGAPFDFRKAPNEQQEYFDALKQLTEDMYATHGGQRVVFLLHSMGGPMMWYFLAHQSQSWKNKYVEAVISLAGAWGGSVKAVKVYTAGDNLGIYLISPLAIRSEQRSATSLSFLLPSSEVWDSSEVLIETPGKNYTTANFDELFVDMELPDAYDIYHDTKDLLKGISPPGVELYCLYGHGVDTVERLVYKEGNYFPDSPQLVFGDGDGTVNLRSAQVCTSFASKQKQKVHSKGFDKMEHMAILDNSNSISYVLEILQNITQKNEKSRPKEETLMNMVVQKRDVNPTQDNEVFNSVLRDDVKKNKIKRNNKIRENKKYRNNGIISPVFWKAIENEAFFPCHL